MVDLAGHHSLRDSANDFRRSCTRTCPELLERREHRKAADGALVAVDESLRDAEIAESLFAVAS